MKMDPEDLFDEDLLNPDITGTVCGLEDCTGITIYEVRQKTPSIMFELNFFPIFTGN